jgi:hypothetical protein
LINARAIQPQTRAADVAAKHGRPIVIERADPPIGSRAITRGRTQDRVKGAPLFARYAALPAANAIVSRLPTSWIIGSISTRMTKLDGRERALSSALMHIVLSASHAPCICMTWSRGRCRSWNDALRVAYADNEESPRRATQGACRSIARRGPETNHTANIGVERARSGARAVEPRRDRQDHCDVRREDRAQQPRRSGRGGHRDPHRPG